jgi:hypothetical protein
MSFDEKKFYKLGFDKLLFDKLSFDELRLNQFVALPLNPNHYRCRAAENKTGILYYSLLTNMTREDKINMTDFITLDSYPEEQGIWV